MFWPRKAAGGSPKVPPRRDVLIPGAGWTGAPREGSACRVGGASAPPLFSGPSGPREVPPGQGYRVLRGVVPPEAVRIHLDLVRNGLTAEALGEWLWLPHTGGLNRAGTIRYAVYFRYLDAGPS